MLKSEHFGPMKQSALMMPVKYTQSQILKMTRNMDDDDDDNDDTINIPLYQPVDDSLAMIYLALKLRRDILSD